MHNAMIGINSPWSWTSFATAAPLLAVFSLLILSFPRSSQKQGKHAQSRKRKSGGGFSASTFSLGLALQNIEKLIHHNVQHAIVQISDQDEDESGDPDDPKAQMNRQLKRIRRGEEIDRLILRMKSSPPRS
jgi:hypothetical protein